MGITENTWLCDWHTTPAGSYKEWKQKDRETGSHSVRSSDPAMSPQNGFSTVFASRLLDMGKVSC